MTQGTMGTPDGAEETRVLDASAAGDNAGRVNNEVFDVLFGGETEAWPEQSTKKGLRASWPIAVLVALLLVIGGVGLGAYLQRSHSTTSTAATGHVGFAGFGGAAAAAAAGGAGGAGAAGGAATSDVTSGTVTDIIGNTLYVTNSSGNLVKVIVSSTTTVDRDAASTLSGLKPGDTVTVQGPTAKNGSVSAASISATAKGVTVAGGGFGGFGGGGAGAAARG
jgi:uncharacterized protein DUF5666